MQERRLMPRFPCQLSLVISTPDQQTYRVEAYEISQAGIAFNINRDILLSLASQGISLDVGGRFQLRLSSSRNASPFKCQVKHNRRLSEQEYQIGAWFDELGASQKMKINSILEQARSEEL